MGRDRVLKAATRGSGAQGLRGALGLHDASKGLAEFARVPLSKAELGAGDEEVIEPAVAIREVDLASLEGDGAGVAIEGMDANEAVGDLPVRAAGVHDDRAADARGDAAEAFEPGPAESHDLGDERAEIDPRADEHRLFAFVELDGLELAGVQRDDEVGDSGVIDEQVRPLAEDAEVGIDFNAGAEMVEGLGRGEAIGPSPDPEPGLDRVIAGDVGGGGEHGGRGRRTGNGGVRGEN